MKKILLIICYIFMVLVECFAQEKRKTFDQEKILQEDSIEIAQLEAKHNVLMPLNIGSQITIFDKIYTELFRDPAPYKASFLDKNQKYYNDMKEQFKELEKKINRADVCFADYKKTSEEIRNKCRKSPGLSNKKFLFNRKILRQKEKAYDKALNEVRWKENSIAFRTYFVFHDRDVRRYPLFTLFLGKYMDKKLEQSREQWRRDSTGQIVKMDSLQRKTEMLSQNSKKKEGELNWIIDSLNNKVGTIKGEIKQKERESIELSDALYKTNKELERNNEELHVFKGFLLDLKQEKERAESDKKDREENISSLIKKRKFLEDTISILNIKNQDLIKENTRQEEIKDSILFNFRLTGVFFGLLILVSFILVNVLWRLRKKSESLRRAYIRDSQMRETLQEQNKKLTEANLSLDEKSERHKLLVREMHHRTRNNLQQISSLLYLKAESQPKGPSKSVLEEATSRVHILGIIHEQLYRNPSQNLTFVNLAQYIKKMVEYLVEANGFHKKKIDITLDLQEIYIEMDTATQLGLLINELLQNCFKHAFKKNEHPALRILSHMEGNILHISLSDNGPGFPEDVDWETTSSFGLRFVRRFISGKEGNIRYESSPAGGSTFYLTLPMPSKDFEIKTST